MVGYTMVYNDSQYCVTQIAINTNDNKMQMCTTRCKRSVNLLQFNKHNNYLYHRNLADIRSCIHTTQITNSKPNLELAKNHADTMH